MFIACNALRLLDQEGLFHSTVKIPSIDVSAISASVSDKYKNVSVNKSILDILNNADKYLSGQETYEELIRNGHKSKSSDIKRDIYIALYKLHKEKKLISKKVGNKKKYTIIGK